MENAIRIYLIKVKVTSEGYSETVEVLEDMEEKARIIIGSGIRIDRNDIDIVRRNEKDETYEMWLKSEGKILKARKLIKEAAYQHYLQQLDELKKTVDLLEKHELPERISISKFEKKC